MRKVFLPIGIGIVFLALLHLTKLERVAATTATAVKIASLSNVNSIDSTTHLWQGTWVSAKTKKSGGFQVIFQRQGSNIVGNIKIESSPITKGGVIRGTIKGNKLEFGLVKDKRGALKYVGVISEDTMSGTWQIPIIKDHGTWQATKIKSKPTS